MPNRHWLVVLLMLGGVGAAQAQRPVQGPAGLSVSGSLRLRSEGWDWFADGAGGTAGRYAYGASLLRTGARFGGQGWEAVVEGAAPLLLGLPQDAGVPAPQGPLGLGATYRSMNGQQVASLVLKQAHLRGAWALGAASRFGARAGRFEFSDGAEVTPVDPTLARLKKAQLQDRLLGSFSWSHVGRSFDGAELQVKRHGVTLSGLVAQPTSGAFTLNGNERLPVTVGYGSLVRSGRQDEFRLFGLQYDDGRGLTVVDNRAPTAREADARTVRFTTIGGHYIRAIPTSTGTVDLLLWGVLQRGTWGSLSHRASAYVAEVGWQPRLTNLSPWVRLGVSRGSGDGDAADGVHGTFIPVLPTPRIFARFPFYGMMNSDDRWIEATIQPSAAITVRSDVHRLRLASAADGWYAGGGAFDATSFGYGLRPSGGSRELATLVDASLDLRLDRQRSVTVYAGRAFGGAVVGQIFATNRNANFVYLEVLQRF